MIPYTTERRADTGVTNVTLGIWLFIASEVMLFGALFSSYALLRVAAIDWPSGRSLLSVPLGATNAVLLLQATVFAWRAQTAALDLAKRRLALGALLALAFLGVMSVEFAHEIATGHTPSASTFLAMYFTLSGVHAVHVAGGAAANLWVLTGAARVGETMTSGRIRALATYWAFVNLVWLTIFVLMYLS